MAIERETTPARTHFALALAGVLVPFMGFFVSAGLAALALLRPHPDPAHNAWTKRLFALAVVDFLVLCSVLAFAQGRAKLPEPRASRPGPRIGVILDPRDPGGGATIASTKPGSPADIGGVRAGDVITAVDGAAIADNAALRKALDATPEGQARSLAIAREGATIEARVVPDRSVEVRGPSPPLFQPREGAALGRATLIDHLRSWGTLAALVAVVAVVGSRRGAPAPLSFWIAFSSVIALSDAVLLGATVGVARFAGGPSLGGSLIGLVAATAALLGGAALWRARLARTDTLPAPEGSWPVLSTIVGGVGALFAGTIRVGIVLGAVNSLLHLPDVDPGHEVRELVALAPGPAAIVTLAFAAVILAPIGEETLFRGVVLPWLCRWMSEEAAVWVSAVVFAAAHYRYGHYMLVVVVYGVVLGVARLRTGSLRASMLLHAIINTVALVAALRGG